MKRLLCVSLSLLMLLGCSRTTYPPVTPLHLDPSAEPADLSGHVVGYTSTGRFDVRSSNLTKFTFTALKPLSGSLFELDDLYFDTNTIWPKQLPDGFSPHETIETNKTPGLGLKDLHKQGYTGKGINVAIVDSILLTDHVEYKDRLVYYKNLDTQNKTPPLRGGAIASILAGKTIGVAPECNLYYVAVNSGDDSNTDTSYSYGEDYVYPAYLEGITHILDLNDTLPQEDKIQILVVSKHLNLINMRSEYLPIKQRIESANIYLVSESYDEPLQFDIATKRPLDDPDDFSAYFPRNYIHTRMPLIPTGNLTLAATTGVEDYVFYPNANETYSWKSPYVAGCYALALQADPTITPERFHWLATETSVEVKWNIPAELRSSPWYLSDTVILISPAGIIDALTK